jgi:predicted RNase H-like HicB family nuclease
LREPLKSYAVVIESGPNNLSAYLPDLPGCITTGGTVEEVEQNIREAIELHLEGIVEDGGPIPEPQ